MERREHFQESTDRYQIFLRIDLNARDNTHASCESREYPLFFLVACQKNDRNVLLSPDVKSELHPQPSNVHPVGPTTLNPIFSDLRDNLWGIGSLHIFAHSFDGWGFNVPYG